MRQRPEQLYAIVSAISELMIRSSVMPAAGR